MTLIHTGPRRDDLTNLLDAPPVEPFDLVAELAESTVDGDVILGVARPLGPLRAELQTDNGRFEVRPGAPSSNSTMHRGEFADVVAAHHRVETAQQAERVGFRSSPTILIDGVDSFAADSDPVGGLSCRVAAVGPCPSWFVT